MTDNTQITARNPHCDRGVPGTDGLPYYVERLQLAFNGANALANLLRADSQILENATVHSHSDETAVPFDSYTRCGLHDAMVTVAQAVAASTEAVIENWGRHCHRVRAAGGAE